MRLLSCVLTALPLAGAPAARLLAGAPVAAAAAAAAAPWSSPAALPGTQPLLVGGAGGPRAVYWDVYPPGLPTPGGFTTAASLLGPGLLPASAQPLSPPIQLGSGDLAAAAYGPASVALAHGDDDVATGSLAGPLALHRLRATVRDVAGNAAGDLAAVIEPCAITNFACAPAAPEVVIASRGHGFGRPIALDRHARGGGAAVAVDTHSRVLAAWDSRGGVYACFVSTRGKLGPIQRLGPVLFPTSLAAVYSADGRAAVGWTSQAVTDGVATSPFTATVSLAAATHRFGRAALLGAVRVTGTGRYIPYRGLVLRLPARQPGLAVWDGYDGSHYAVRAAAIVGTRIGAAQTVSPTTVGAPAVVSDPTVDSVLADAAEGSRTEAVILVLPGRAGEDPPPSSAGPGGLAAVTRPAPAQPFGALETIVPGRAFIDGAAVAIDAASGAPFATWRDVGAPVGWSVRSSIG